MLICYILSVFELFLPPCPCYGMVSAQVLPEHKEMTQTDLGDFASFSCWEVGHCSVAFVSKCCEKLFPEQLTAKFCFLQKAQENVVAFLKARLHF